MVRVAKTNPCPYKHIYFLGIGGIGMSAIARYFKAMGKNVSGYDKTSTSLTNELVAEGIDIHFEDDLNLVKPEFKIAEDVLIVYTPAVPKDHKELNYFIDNKFNIKKRAEVLGLITKSTYTVAVAGTHGKTTTSSLIAHIFKVAHLDPSAFLGGITQNYNTNLLLSKDLVSPSPSPLERVGVRSSLVVVEADEYDRSFLTLYPQLAVITSVDADHMDIYGDKIFMEESYSLFAKQVQSKLVVKKSIEDTINAAVFTLTYSLNDATADYYAQHVKVENAEYKYEVVTPNGVFKNITLGLPGFHNVENSIAAIAIACLMDVSEDNIRLALKTFRGVKRRFDYQVKTDKLVFIDDYAHHPEELKACINSVKEMYPDKKITGIFQPHLFTRTRDFADDFAQSLDLLDECILMEIYPARELPIAGIDSKMLLDKMKLKNKRISQKKDLVQSIDKNKVEVLLTLGAGDIDTFVEQLKNKLQ